MTVAEGEKCPARRSRSHELKDTGLRSINFTDEAVEDFYFLFTGAVGLFDGLVDEDFFYERVEQFGGQLCRVGLYMVPMYVRKRPECLSIRAVLRRCAPGEGRCPCQP